MALAWIVDRIESRPANLTERWNSRWRRRLRRPFVLSIALLVLVYAASNLFAVAPRISFWGSYERLQGTYSLLCYIALFSLIAGTLRTRAEAERVVTAMILAGIPVCLYAVAQSYGLDPIPWGEDVKLRVASTLGSANFLGAYLLMLVPLTLGRLIGSLAAWRKERTKSHVVAGGVYLTVGLAQLAGIVLSQCRAPILGLGGALFVMGLLLIAMRSRHRTGGGGRRLGLAWVSAGVLGALLVLALNLPGTGLYERLRFLRELPRFGQLVNYSADETESIKNRLLIWDATLELAALREPLGIAGDATAGADRFHRLRSLLGYGPESMLQVFPRIRPPDIGGWDTSIDRVHNETLDRWVTTGLAGVAAFYVFTIVLFERLLIGLGLSPAPQPLSRADARRRPVVVLATGGAAGAGASVLLTGRFTFVALGSAAGLIAALIVSLCWRGAARRETLREGFDLDRSLLSAGLAAALIGHFIEIQFSFPVAVTHTYFWIDLALFVVVSRPEPVAQTPVSGRREAVVQGWIVAMILVVLSFGFFTPRFDFTSLGSLLVFGFSGLVWLSGLALLPAPRALGAYSVVSLGSALLWIGVGRLCFLENTGWFRAPAEAVRKTDAVAASFVLWLAAMLALVVFLAAHCRESRDVEPAPRRRRPVWLSAPLVAAAVALVWLKNVDVVRADIYLRGAERARQLGQWAAALELHQIAIAKNRAEDRYHLALAATCQRMLRDHQLDPELRRGVWQQGEESALAAWRLNPYNPDNAANLGRYYRTSTVLFGKRFLPEAFSYFDKALALAPSNALFRNSRTQALELLKGD